ncbi:MAG: adenylate/guanylate cyclase domain-containing protein [Leptolyngbyaceae cyanobacterium bins.59]|nr:adenylate/guanylate cyclase domain-containing protein [Leptolyngbyaceae cyanobacterium bins.59]
MEENDIHQRGIDIFIIDDQIDNIQILAELLTQQGYKVRKALSGQMALVAIATEPPDLILLDISMPQMDGYEICQTLKSSAKTREIPVIFVSALGDLLDKAKAFAVGGADYITKPFHAEEVLMRIKNQATLALQYRQLKQAEARYRSIFENSTEGIFQATQEGKYLNVNPALARIFGYDSPEELMNSIANIGRQLYVKPERRDELRVYLQQFKEITGAESEVYRKDGSQIWISENVWIVKDTNDNFSYYEGTVQDITERHQMEVEMRREHWRSERLLTNILPFQIARRLKTNTNTIADYYEEVTVLFADLVNFTAASARMSPPQLVTLLNSIFSAFDQLAERHGLEKIKTIGDAYMVASGLPTPCPDHAQSIAQMALEMQQVIQQFPHPVSGEPFQLRIGINSGSVTAGVIGIKKFIYDLWGDTVNIASRMEATGEAGKIQVTASTYERIKHRFQLKPRGKIYIKGKGEMVTYWLVG